MVLFLSKQPFYGGKKHRIVAEASSPGEKKPFLVVEGEWNGKMTAKWSDGVSLRFHKNQQTRSSKNNKMFRQLSAQKHDNYLLFFYPLFTSYMG